MILAEECQVGLLVIFRQFYTNRELSGPPEGCIGVIHGTIPDQLEGSLNEAVQVDFTLGPGSREWYCRRELDLYQ